MLLKQVHILRQIQCFQELVRCFLQLYICKDILHRYQQLLPQVEEVQYNRYLQQGICGLRSASCGFSIFSTLTKIMYKSNENKEKTLAILLFKVYSMHKLII